MLGVLAASFDRVVTTAVLQRSGRTAQEAALGAVERARALHALLERYEDCGDFFEEPTPARPAVQERKRNVIDLRWPSDYEPFNRDIAAEYLSHGRNLTCVVRLFPQKKRPRGTVILLHGYLGGVPTIEERIWPVDWFLQLGFNVGLFVLPFHGPRGRPLTPPIFPGADPRITIEGFRQAVHDLRRFVLWVEEQGLGPTGVMGMSLGGYTSALVATVEQRLSFVVPFIPLASIAKFAMDRGRFVGSRIQKEQQRDLVDRLYRVVSPLARPVLVPPGGRLVVAGEADRITPVEHARMIAEHFEAPLETFAGGHVVQIGRTRAFSRIGRMLDQVC